jgi:hypothetical protein
LIRKFGLLEEILDFLGIVEVTPSTNAFNLLNLSCASHSLEVLEVNLGILTEVDYRSEIVVKT